jgi:hypothetical protein
MNKRTNKAGPLPAREPRPPAPPLEEPRPAPWGDLVAAGRRSLLHQWDAERKPTHVSPPWGPEGELERAFAKLGKYVNATAAPYGQYQVDPDITNDEMGYGERVSDELLRVGDGAGAKVQPRVRQRTKTGWQAISPAADSPSPASAQTAATSPRRARGATRGPAKPPGSRTKR